MKKYSSFIMIAVCALIIVACGSKSTDNFAGEFNSKSTEEKMKYLQENMTPDSVAVFLSQAAMGELPDIKINLNEALLYAYENYGEEDLVEFMEAQNNYVKTLPLKDKLKYSKLGGMEDLEVYSYEMGLKYVGSIREEKKDVKEIQNELSEFRKACQSDPAFFKRFMVGFKLALQQDRFHDLDDKIYQTFINYQDSI